LADLDTAEAQEPALGGGLGHRLTDATQPRLERGRVVRRLGVEQRRRVADRRNRLGLDLARLAPGERGLQPLPGGGAPFGGLGVRGPRLGGLARARVALRLEERVAGDHALLQRPPQSAGLGRGDRDAGHHHALQHLRPFLGGETRLGRHARNPPQLSSSFGTFPPLSASFCSTVLCSHMFICAESPIFSAGQPSSVASSLRAPRLLSRSRSLSRSTIETFQLSFCGFVAARPSSLVTTSTTVIATGGGGAVITGAAVADGGGAAAT